MRVLPFAALLLVGCSGSATDATMFGAQAASGGGAGAQAGAAGAVGGAGGTGSLGGLGGAGTAGLGSGGTAGAQAGSSGQGGDQAGSAGSAGDGGTAAGSAGQGGDAGASAGTAGAGGAPPLSYPDPYCPGFTVYRVPQGKCLWADGKFVQRSLASSACPTTLTMCATVTNEGQCPACGQPGAGSSCTSLQAACDGAFELLSVGPYPNSQYGAQLLDGNCATACQ